VQGVVVGGGISGLATARALQTLAARRSIALKVRLLEAGPRLGGTMRTLREDGYLVECGPSGWLASRGVATELARAAGCNVIAANASASRRYVAQGGALTQVPTGPAAFLKSQLLSFGGRMRVLREPWVPPGDGVEESVSTFVTRRFGPEAVPLAEAMVSGVFAGDADSLSMHAAFPAIARLERAGGVLRGAAARRGTAGLLSVADGLQALAQAVAATLDDAPRCDTQVTALRRGKKFWSVRTSDGNALRADVVVLATPAADAAVLLEAHAPDGAAAVADIPYAPVVVVALGIPRRHIAHPLDGFGFLSPRRELPLLGAVWESSVFAGRAPGDHVLVRVMLGGPGVAEAALEDGELCAYAVERLSRLVGVSGTPTFMRVIRHPRAIPQYTLGHDQRMQRLRAALADCPGLFVTGNAFAGVSLAECIQAANDLALRILPLH
jgi:oxygen-dependent protoporphyrinogen oxidase